MPTAKAEGTSKEVYLLDALPAGAAHVGGVADDPPGASSTGQTPLSASAANAAAANDCTLAGAAGKTTYITGFAVTGGGATAASLISVTLTGTIGGTLNFKLPIPAGAAVAVTPLIVSFARPLAASAANTAIVLNVPSFGAGNTAAAAAAWGFQQ